MSSSARESDHLISAQALSGLSAASSNDLLIADCSFDLLNPEQGYLLYQQAHIPGAAYVHLERDLSGSKTGRNGRHPLPDRDVFVERLRELGIDNNTRVVAYDNAGGPYAARLWWLLRWVGHDKVAVLDGGLEGWRRAGYDTASGSAVSGTQRAQFSAAASLVRSVSFDEVLANLATRQALVVDARAADRFGGRNETIDPVAGHIPDAVNRFFRDNLNESGFFKQPEQLRAEFEAVLGAWNSSQVINQCGSGVTGCHNLLAMEVAGLGGAALYPGSWSEWVAQPGAPVATTSV